MRKTGHKNWPAIHACFGQFLPIDLRQIWSGRFGTFFEQSGTQGEYDANFAEKFIKRSKIAF